MQVVATKAIKHTVPSITANLNCSIVHMAYSPLIALMNGVLGILTLLPIIITGKGNFAPFLMATLIEYGLHPKYDAISVGTNISFGRASISSNVIFNHTPTVSQKWDD